MNNRESAVWFPANRFNQEAEQRYLHLFLDLCEVGEALTIKCWDRDGAGYQHSVVVEVRPYSPNNENASLQLAVTKRYLSRSNSRELEKRGFKRAQPTSPFWLREFSGETSPSVLANYALFGILHASEFMSNPGIQIICDSDVARVKVDEVIRKHDPWFRPSSIDLHL